MTREKIKFPKKQIARLKKIKIKNFKAFREAEIEFKPLTVLLGANASGKSTILQSLLLLKQSWESPDPQSTLVWDGRHIELPSFDDILNKSSKDKKLSFELNLISEQNELGVCFSIKQIRGIGIAVDRTTFYLLKNDEKINISKTTTFRQHFRPDRFLFQPVNPDIKTGKGKLAKFARVLEEVKKGIDEIFRQIFHIYPLRKPIKRFVYYSGETLSFPGREGERLLEFLKANEGVYRKLKDWSEQNLCKKFELKTKGGQLFLEIDGINAADTGFGFSQLLPILATLYGVPEGALILLEQPEIHLNPALVVKLADFCSDIAKEGKKVLLIETHSDHFIWRIRRRIAEDIEEKLWKNAAIYFIERNTKEAFSTIKPVKITKFGEIEDPPWPKDFLAPDITDAFKTLEGKLQRLKIQGVTDGISD